MTKATLIVGCAPCVWEDVALLTQRCRKVVLNRMIVDFPGKAEFGVTAHPDFAKHYATGRFPIWSWREEPGVDHIYWRQLLCGSSSLYAVEVVDHVFGPGPIILAGCPMDDSGHYYDREKMGEYLPVYRHAWENAAPLLAGRVRSLSGWTKQLLGAP